MDHVLAHPNLVYPKKQKEERFSLKGLGKNRMWVIDGTPLEVCQR
jgi:hypothetical protein